MADNIAEQEYSLQHYDFTPENFYKDFSEMIIRELALVVHQTMKCVSLQSEDGQVQDYLVKVYSKFHDEWSKRTITVLDEIKPLIYEFFKIPSHVLLPSDRIQVKQVTEEQLEELKNEVALLEKECLQELTRKEMFLAELESLSKIKPIENNFDKAATVIKQIQTTLNEIQDFDGLIINIDHYHNVTKQKQIDNQINNSEDEIELGHKFVIDE